MISVVFDGTLWWPAVSDGVAGSVGLSAYELGAKTSHRIENGKPPVPPHRRH